MEGWGATECAFRLITADSLVVFVDSISPAAHSDDEFQGDSADSAASRCGCMILSTSIKKLSHRTDIGVLPPSRKLKLLAFSNTME